MAVSEQQLGIFNINKYTHFFSLQNFIITNATLTRHMHNLNLFKQATNKSKVDIIKL